MHLTGMVEILEQRKDCGTHSGPVWQHELARYTLDAVQGADYKQQRLDRHAVLLVEMVLIRHRDVWGLQVAQVELMQSGLGLND